MEAWDEEAEKKSVFLPRTNEQCRAAVFDSMALLINVAYFTIYRARLILDIYHSLSTWSLGRCLLVCLEITHPFLKHNWMSIDPYNRQLCPACKTIGQDDVFQSFQVVCIPANSSSSVPDMSHGPFLPFINRDVSCFYPWQDRSSSVVSVLQERLDVGHNQFHQVLHALKLSQCRQIH